MPVMMGNIAKIICTESGRRKKPLPFQRMSGFRVFSSQGVRKADRMKKFLVTLLPGSADRLYMILKGFDERARHQRCTIFGPLAIAHCDHLLPEIQILYTQATGLGNP